MSETPSMNESESESKTQNGNRTANSSRDTASRVRRGLDYALLGGLVLLGVFAALQFYFAADRTINVWVTREYRPPFKMVFNLIVLLVVGIGLSRQVRRLTGTADGDEDDQQVDATADGGTVLSSATVSEQSASPPETTHERGTERLDSSGDESGDDTGRS